VRRIVELHGSTISVDSGVGQGTVFGFDLQRAADAAPSAVTVAAAPPV